MTTPPEFVYEPLPPTHIRLLGIEESQTEDELKFSLAIHHRFDAPPYIALSYHWGHEPPLHPLIVDGKIINVRPTLWEALNHVLMSEEVRAKNWQYIWCDAVCINQADIEEKNQQVRAMYEIYHNAFLVIGWLGTEHTQKYGNFAPTDPAEITNSNGDLPQSYFENEIYQRPYLYRMWIIQELVAARDLLLLLGRMRIYADDIWDVSTYFRSQTSQYRRQHSLLKQGFSKLPSEGLEEYPIVSWMNETITNTFGEAKLSVLVDWIRFSSESVCSDPKDRIFALLNVLPAYETAVLYTFFPDYTLSLERTQMITLAFLRQSWAKGSSSTDIEDLLTLLRVYPQSLREELRFQSNPGADIRIAELSHGFWAVTHPVQYGRQIFKNDVGDQEYIATRVKQLRVIASKPLSTELSAQTKLLKAKAWYTPES